MNPRTLFKAMRDDLLLCCKGAIVGTGAILPGVSGGVLCVAFGIYQPMMALLSHPFKAFHQYYRMLIPFLIGWVAGFVLLARGVELLFDASSSIAMALFAGLICGTLPELIKKSEQASAKQSWSAFTISMAVIFAVLMLLRNSAMAAVTPTTIWYVFCGAAWGLSLVIPGLSSSSLLIFMGLYQPMAAGIANLNFSVILPLLGGLILTIAVSARFVTKLFDKNYVLASRIILGAIIPSALLILPTSFADILDALLCIVCFASGFAIARWMDMAGVLKAKEQDAHSNNKVQG